jgi:signal transduction histidine kinase
MKRHEILLVNDEPHLLKTVGGILEDKGYLVREASSADAAIKALSKSHFDLVIADTTVGHGDDLTILRKAKELNPETLVIMLTGHTDGKAATDVLRLGADDYLLKPCELDVLVKRVEKCFERLELRRRDEKPEESLPSPNDLILNMGMVISHDIRGSLVSMTAGLKMLGKGAYGNMDEAVSTKVKGLLSTALKLIGTTEDFLSKAFLFDGSLKIRRELLDLKEDIVDPVLDEFSGDIRDNHVRLENRLNAKTPKGIPIKANRIWLRVVFRNLLRNAIKYGGEGCTVAVGLKNRGGHYRLNIFNSGNPIPEQWRDKLFGKFARIGVGVGSDGLGLGLYLSREIIRKHGGDIWYEAKEHGSNFVFTLPRELPPR